MNAEAESIRLRREEDHLVTDQFLSPEEESRLAVESMVMQARNAVKRLAVSRLAVLCC